MSRHIKTQRMNLKIDYAFKLVFGSKGNEDILCDLLNEILGLPFERKITGVHLLNPTIEREYHEDKKSIMDILAVTIDGRFVNIEIQLDNNCDIVRRTLYYWSDVYNMQLKQGMEHHELAKTITINIVDFKLLPQTQKYHTTFHLYEKAEKFLLTDIMEIHFIEMPKLKRKWLNKKVNPWENRLVRWLLLLEAADDKIITDMLEEIAMEDPILQKAIEEWDKASNDYEAHLAYRSRRNFLLDERSKAKRMQQTEEKMQQTEEKIKHAEEKYQEIQREVQRAKEHLIKTVNNLLQMGMADEKIAQVTGLSLSEIEQIKAQLSV